MASLTEMASKLFDLREQKDTLSAELKDLQKKLDDLEEELIEAMIHEGMDRFDLQGQASFYTAVRHFYKVTDKNALLDFIHEQGDTDLLSVQHQTLNAYAKEMIARKEAEGIEDYMIPGVGFTSKTGIRVRKATRS